MPETSVATMTLPIEGMTCNHCVGTVTKAELIDPAVANAAFALKDGEVSAPVQGRFGVVLLTADVFGLLDVGAHEARERDGAP